MPNYYDGTKILSMLDLDKLKPEIYMITTNRTGGKTTYFGRMFVKKFIENREKFALLYRYNYELDNVDEKFFKDIGGLFFPGYTMTSAPMCGKNFRELRLHVPSADEDEIGESCGYAITLNNADQVKKNSHLFSDVQRILFDEFQSETNKYCPDELTKFQSIHTSIARGQGKQTRYVPVYMLSNPVSIINPYYVEFGIAERLQDNTKFLKGHGWVLENGWIKSASDAMLQSGFNRAFASSKYVDFASRQGVYLNDNQSFVEKPCGDSKYLATIVYNGKEYAIREYFKDGIVYCDDHDDSSYKFKIAVTTEDHKTNYVMLRNNDMCGQTMRFYFERGCVRLKKLQCKEDVLKLVSYR